MAGGSTPSDWDTGTIVPDDEVPQTWDDFPLPTDIEPAEDEISYTTYKKSLVGVANALRSAMGTTEKLRWPYGYVTAIAWLKQKLMEYEQGEGGDEPVEPVEPVEPTDEGNFMKFEIFNFQLLEFVPFTYEIRNDYD